MSHAPFQCCALIPIYNNKDTISHVLDRLAVFNLPCLVVNDGSNQETRAVLQQLQQNRELVWVKHLPQNGGKGAAVKAGLLWADELGYSHALQVDADGQHHIEDAPRFLEAGRVRPEAVVLGKPVFGPDVPKARLYGRQLSKFFVRLETLSAAIGDPLFGFRLYPVAPAARLVRTAWMGSRMDFDPEIAVRLCWLGLPIVNLESPVFYPEGGVSHFRMVKDNLLITWLHTRLCFGMILRFPLLLWRRR